MKALNVENSLKNSKKNKPKENVIIQQTYKTFRPKYTLRQCLPLNLLLAIICGTFSILLYLQSLSEWELVLDYTDCKANKQSICTLNFSLNENIDGSIDFYYGLDGFYQSARAYLRSRSDMQLFGDVYNLDGCNNPYKIRTNITVNSKLEESPIAPCGAMADSMFNDTFKLFKFLKKNNQYVEVPYKPEFGFDSEPKYAIQRERKYRNPKTCKNISEPCLGFENVGMPISWQKPISMVGDKLTGRAFENFDFMIWMETAMMPQFRKPYRRLNQNDKTDLTSKLFSKGLSRGYYVLEITNNYPLTRAHISSYKARKKFIIAKRTFFSGRRGGAKFAAFIQSIVFLSLSAFSILLSLLAVAYY